jgi:hypothetical protein
MVSSGSFVRMPATSSGRVDGFAVVGTVAAVYNGQLSLSGLELEFV